jgi:uncharacterized membrane protein HdeD (DUF308 family)
MPTLEPPRPDDRPNGRGTMDTVMGALFVLFGLLFLVIPHSSSRQGMFLLIGVVNIVVGIIKISRGVGSQR